MARERWWDEKYPLKVHYGFDRLRTGTLADRHLKTLEDDLSGRTYEEISARIQAAVDDAPGTESEIAKLVPRQDGTSSITDRHLRTLIGKPYKMTAAQVEGLCAACGCSIEYLRGDKSGTIPSFPIGTDEHRTITHVAKALSAYSALVKGGIDERISSDLGHIVDVLYDLGIAPERFDEEGWYDGSILKDCWTNPPDTLTISGSFDGQRLLSLAWSIEDLHACLELLEDALG